MKVKLLFLSISFVYALNLNITKFITKDAIEFSEKMSKTSSRNLKFILEKAVQNKIITSIDKYRLHIIYSKLKNGSIFLAKCLKTKGCNPYKFYKEVYNKPPLYKYIYLKYPNISNTLLIQKVGQVNEKIMDKYFQKSGWKKIEGEVGRNGVDGLYIKYDENGNIKDVMLVEAKYNKSTINRTVDGSMQMSKEWSIKKIDELIKKYPDNKEYKIIKEKLLNRDYRARLWRMKEEDNKLIIDLKKILPEGKNIKIEPLKGGEKTKINYKDNFIIDINNPKTPFQKEVLEWYKEAINEI